jgi:hypothetical protein
MCEENTPTTAQLPPGEAPREARTVARAALCLHHAAAADAAVELIASELVTDSVRHGAPPIELTIECHVTEVVVTVTDAGSWRPPAQGEAPDLSWVLVDKIARSWGVEPTSTGRMLWCSIPSGAVPEGEPGDRRPTRVVKYASG